jgi:hypothetical protein
MRARFAGEVQRHQAALNEALSQLSDCDRTILLLFPDGAPARIPAVRAWKNFLGRRGALRKTLLAILREQAPGALTTPQIEAQMHQRLNLRFDCKKDRWRWRANSLAKALQDVLDDGLVERTQRGTFGVWPRIPTMWRWKSGVKSLEMLAAEMDVAGLAYEYVKAEPEDATA